MLKFTSQLSNNHLVLVRKSLKHGPTTTYILVRNKNLCIPPPPPPRRTFKSRFFWGLAGLTFVTGTAVIYAKNSPETRSFLSINAPWADSFVALMYQENTTFGEFALTTLSKAKAIFSDLAFGKEGVEPIFLPTRQDQDLEKEALENLPVKTYKLPPQKFKPLYKEEKPLEPPEMDFPATLVQTEKCEPKDCAPPDPSSGVSLAMVELEQAMHEHTKAAIDGLRAATKQAIDYNEKLYNIVEKSSTDVSAGDFSGLMAAKGMRDSIGKEAIDHAKKAHAAIDGLDRLFEAGVAAPPEVVTSTKRYIKTFRKDLGEAEAAYNEQVEKSVLADRYWNKVEAARLAFKDELEALYPGIRLNCRTVDLPGETDLFLLHVMKKVSFLQKELAELQTIREHKLNQAMICKETDDLISNKIDDLVNRERIALESDYLKKTLLMEAEAKKKLHDALIKQQANQQEILRQQLAQIEAEMAASANRKASEEIEKMRVEYKKQIAELTGKMKAIEETIKERQSQEEAMRKAQALWAAAESLLAATRRSGQVVPLADEIAAIESAAEKDEAVKTILKAIREEVRKEGVITERALREKYDQMEKTALKVALVGHKGGSLMVYILSWMQSKLVFMQSESIPTEELENKPVDFSNFDTFDIIARSRYHMDHGNIENALKYVNLLQGASRAAARTWVQDALKHLEVKQAAETVMAHATANAMAMQVGSKAK